MESKTKLGRLLRSLSYGDLHRSFDKVHEKTISPRCVYNLKESIMGPLTSAIYGGLNEELWWSLSEDND